MGSTVGCTLAGTGAGKVTCPFSCPTDDSGLILPNGWVLYVSATDDVAGSVVTGSCGSESVSCTVDATGECEDVGKVHGSPGLCSFTGSPNGTAVCTLLMPAAASKLCDHSSPHTHTYGSGGSVGARSDRATGGNDTGVGVVTVSETNMADCNGDGVAGDYDGDWETGVGGGFFGYGHWANEPICQYGLTVHSNAVTVNDILMENIAFVIGADDTGGPTISTDPVSGETTCSTDGAITPCPPPASKEPCGPTDDPDDCLTQVYVGTGTTCGAGGDGGYWVFLNGAFVGEDENGVVVSDPPTAGFITA